MSSTSHTLPRKVHATAIAEADVMGGLSFCVQQAPAVGNSSMPHIMVLLRRAARSEFSGGKMVLPGTHS